MGNLVIILLNACPHTLENSRPEPRELPTDVWQRTGREDCTCVAPSLSLPAPRVWWQNGLSFMLVTAATGLL